MHRFVGSLQFCHLEFDKEAISAGFMAHFRALEGADFKLFQGAELLWSLWILFLPEKRFTYTCWDVGGGGVVSYVFG